MKKATPDIFAKIKKEVFAYPLIYILLTVILVAAFIVRVWRVSDLLGFYYDQGRDALVIWDLWHSFKPFLIGPITGLKGIFLGPFYYFLIAPFYLIGRGNPAFPAVFLSFTTVLAVFMLYILGTKMHSRVAGLIAAFIGAFSYNIFTLSRWLSNPTPMLFLSTLLFWFLWEIVNTTQSSEARTQNLKTQNTKYVIHNTNPWWWVLAVLTIGISLHFESASAVFYMPMFAVFAIWQRKKLPPLKYILISGALFLVTLGPQILFNIRHDNILFKNFTDLLFGEKAFRGVTKFILEERLKYFWGVYSGKIFLGTGYIVTAFATISAAMLFGYFSKFKNQIILFAIFFLTPVVGYTLFQGNYGNIYDYYTIGYFMPLILFFAIGMGELAKHWGGFLIIALYFYHFANLNLVPIKNYLTATVATRPIAMEDQLQAVNWVYDDAAKFGREFNVDVYVPPVIPHSYEYLFLWQGSLRQARGGLGCGQDLCGLKKDVTTNVLYTLYEADPPNPHRLEAWLERQEGIGRVIEEARFGQVTVQRRERF